MLVLTRKVGQRIVIGNQVSVTVVRVHGKQVRLGIEAPCDVAVHRENAKRKPPTRARAADHYPAPIGLD